MPDIFLSYSRTDLAIAGKIAAALRAAGHDVWWDQALQSGEVYDVVTETALREARAVVVLWSKAAAASDWVRSEATVAMQRGVLLPVMIEACQRPVMFELRQSADLTGWKGNTKDPRLLAFLGDVGRLLQAADAPKVPVAAPTPTVSGVDRRLVFGGFAAAGLAALGSFAAWRRWGGSASPDATASVAVLPFANLSGDPAQAFFSDGLAEELRIALAQIPGLKVAGRVSSEKLRDTDDLAAAAGQLGVAHLLTGSVRRSAATIRIGAQLVDGKTGADIWSQSYDRPAGDALAVQSSIASSVVEALGARLGVGGVSVGGTRNAAAQELFLKARSLGRLAPTDSSLAERLALFDAAIALDPRYAEAHAGRSNMLNVLASRASDAGLRDAQRKDAMAAARRAVAMAPASGFAHSVLARRLVDTLEIREAVSEAERALRLSPGDARVSVNAGVAVIGLVDPERGIVYSRQGVALDPLNSATFSSMGRAMFALRRYAEMAEAARATIDVSKGELGHQSLTEALTSLGQHDPARRAVGRIPREPDRLALSAILEARAGNRQASDAALARLLGLDNATRDFMLAEVHAQRGEVAEALGSLDKAFASREPNMASILVNPWLDPIRREPRFKALQDRIFSRDLVALAERGRKM